MIYNHTTICHRRPQWLPPWCLSCGGTASEQLRWLSRYCPCKIKFVHGVNCSAVYPRLVGLGGFRVIDLFKLKLYFKMTILTCYATSIVVIYLNLQASVRLFTSNTKWLVPTEYVSWSHVFYFRPSKVNSYKTTLHNLNYV